MVKNILKGKATFGYESSPSSTYSCIIRETTLKKQVNIKKAIINSINSYITVVNICTKNVNCSLYLIYWNTLVKQPNNINNSIRFSTSLKEPKIISFVLNHLEI